MDLLPGILLFAIFPMIVSCQRVKNSLSQYPWFSDEEYRYDFFMYGKSIVFLVLAGWMVFVLADRILIRSKKVRWKRWIPVMLYMALTALSAVCSINRTLSVKGMMEQYETVWVLCGYGITAFYCCQVVEKVEDAKVFLMAIAAGAALQGMLGIFQAAGMDILSTELGRALLTLGQGDEIRQSLEFGFARSGNNKVYLSLYNPNYAGVYLVMVLPVLLSGPAWLAKKWEKRLCLLIGVVMLACLFMCGSKTGVLILVMVTLAAAACFIPRNRKTWMYASGGVLLGIVGIVAFDFAGNHELSKSFVTTFTKIYYNMNKMEPMQDAVRIRYKGKNLDLSVEHTEYGDTLKVIENEQNRLPVYWDLEEACFFIEGDEYLNLRFDAYYENGCQYVVIDWKKAQWLFQKDGTEPYVYINRYGKKDTIQNAPTVLGGYERAFTGRGYLWGRIIPLLKERWLLGTGPDTFVVAFPQNDYLMRMNTSKRMLMEIPAKAHNMYLQSALQTGIFSLLCLLVFWRKYLAECISALRREKTRDCQWWMTFGLTLGVLGYLLMGIFNDSVVAVAPLFWGMLGTGLALAENCCADRNFS